MNNPIETPMNNRSQFERRCITLIETMIAIVLLLAMGALIYPSLMHGIDEQQFETAAEVTNEQLVLARAHAQTTGTPVEVTYNVETSQVEARLFLPAISVFEGLGAPIASHKTKNEPAAKGQSMISELWARRGLANGLRLASRPPADFAKVASLEDEETEFVETLDNLGQGQEVRLAVFMPDGSALLAEEFWLNDENGRVGVFTINPWSGLPAFKRLADLTEAKGDDKHAPHSD